MEGEVRLLVGIEIGECFYSAGSVLDISEIPYRFRTARYVVSVSDTVTKALPTHVMRAQKRKSRRYGEYMNRPEVKALVRHNDAM